MDKLSAQDSIINNTNQLFQQQSNLVNSHKAVVDSAAQLSQAVSADSIKELFRKEVQLENREAFEKLYSEINQLRTNQLPPEIVAEYIEKVKRLTELSEKTFSMSEEFLNGYIKPLLFISVQLTQYVDTQTFHKIVSDSELSPEALSLLNQVLDDLVANRHKT
jgi:hypothetical protein